jgi:predicted nucleic acid-binding protein
VVGGRAYLDASATVKLIVREPESDALVSFLAGRETVMSSRLLEVEVTRAVRRLDPDLEEQARAILAGVESIELDSEIVARASGLDPPDLRSLDAIHLASALTLGPELDAFVTYDARQTAAARARGLVVESPA